MIGFRLFNYEIRPEFLLTKADIFSISFLSIGLGSFASLFFSHWPAAAITAGVAIGMSAIIPLGRQDKANRDERIRRAAQHVRLAAAPAA